MFFLQIFDFFKEYVLFWFFLAKKWSLANKLMENRLVTLRNPKYKFYTFISWVYLGGLWLHFVEFFDNITREIGTSRSALL